MTLQLLCSFLPAFTTSAGNEGAAQSPIPRALPAHVKKPMTSIMRFITVEWA